MSVIPQRHVPRHTRPKTVNSTVVLTHCDEWKEIFMHNIYCNKIYISHVISLDFLKEFWVNEDKSTYFYLNLKI